MALTRKFLAAMGIESDKIDEIVSAHMETVNQLKEDRDKYKALTEGQADWEKKYTTAAAELEKLKSGDWEKKYTDTKAEFDKYKADVDSERTTRAKESAYKALLAEAGVADKRVASIMRVADLSQIELDDAGAVKEKDTLLKGIKDDWADFIQTTATKGAATPTPPENDGGVPDKPSRAAQLAKQYREEHYGKED